MTIGIAIDAVDVDHLLLWQTFQLLSAYQVRPHAICVPLGAVRALSTCFAGEPFHHASSLCRSQNKQQPSSLLTPPISTAICARDVLSNCDVLFGEQFEPYRDKKFCRYRDHWPLLLYDGRLLTGRCIRQTSLLLALNQMGAEQVVVLAHASRVKQHTPKCFYWNLDLFTELEQDHQHHQLLDFLYFPHCHARQSSLAVTVR